MAEKFWTGVGIDVQTALGATKTITAITKANPAVVSSASHGLANGTYVLLEVSGMYEVNFIIARVANQAAGTFELEGIDSTLYNTFVSGTAKAITFGASMSTAVGLNVSGGEAEFADLTTVHDLIKRRAPTVVSAVTASIDSFWDPSNTALQQLNVASKTKTQRAIQIRFTDGTRMLGSAYVAAPLAPTGSAGEVVKTPISLEFQGLPTVYTS
jgi:hypothetical protein